MQTPRYSIYRVAEPKSNVTEDASPEAYVAVGEFDTGNAVWTGETILQLFEKVGRRQEINWRKAEIDLRDKGWYKTPFQL